MNVVRKAQILFRATFEDLSGMGLRPSAAFVRVWFLDVTGVRQNVVLPMTARGDAWEASWSTSTAAGGLVEWASWSEGDVQGATQGSFNLLANKANVQ